MQKDLKTQSDNDFEKHQWMDDVASIDLSLMSDSDHYSDVPMRVTLRWKPGAYRHPHRLSYNFYTADYYPVCEDQQKEKVRNGRNRQMTPARHRVAGFSA